MKNVIKRALRIRKKKKKKKKKDTDNQITSAKEQTNKVPGMSKDLLLSIIEQHWKHRIKWLRASRNKNKKHIKKLVA